MAKAAIVRHKGRTYRVNTYRICDTARWCAEVYEPDKDTLTDHGHSTIAHENGTWWGKLGTRALPAWIDRIPGLGNPTVDERIRLCRRYRQQQARIAQAVLALSGIVPAEARFSYDWIEAEWFAA